MFNSMWTVNFQMFKLVLERAEEPEIKLPTSVGLSKKQREFHKIIYFCSNDYAKAFDCVDHNKLENSERDGNTRPYDLPLEKSVCRSGNKLEVDMEQQTASRERSMSRLYIVARLI